MKRLLLLCCLFAATCTYSFAQSAVSKADYTTKVDQLNSLVGANKIDLAKTQWNLVHDVMKTEFKELKAKYHAAVDAGNEAEKTRIMTAVNAQYKVYYEIMHLKEDMATNKTVLAQKLNDFGNLIL